MCLSNLFPTRRYGQDNIKLDLKDAVGKGGIGSFCSEYEQMTVCFEYDSEHRGFMKCYLIND